MLHYSSRGSAPVGRGSMGPTATGWTSASTEGTPATTGGRVSRQGTAATAANAPPGTKGNSAPSWPVPTQGVLPCYRVGTMECALTRSAGCTACARRGLSGDAARHSSTSVWLTRVLTGAAITW